MHAANIRRLLSLSPAKSTTVRTLKRLKPPSCTTVGSYSTTLVMSNPVHPLLEKIIREHEPADATLTINRAHGGKGDVWEALIGASGDAWVKRYEAFEKWQQVL